jgi:hypothetical protein
MREKMIAKEIKEGLGRRKGKWEKRSMRRLEE